MGLVTAVGLDVCGIAKSLAPVFFQLSWFLKINYNISIQTCATGCLE